jgi:hypothetical protein
MQGVVVKITEKATGRVINMTLKKRGVTDAESIAAAWENASRDKLVELARRKDYVFTVLRGDDAC